MFDFDEEEEILQVLQAAKNYREAEKQSSPRLWQSTQNLALILDDALEKLQSKYGPEIFTYDMDEGK